MVNFLLKVNFFQYNKLLHAKVDVIELESLLKELQSHLVLIDSDNINDEALDNMFAFGLSEVEAQNIDLGQLQLFIKDCYEIYSSNCSNKKLYYCWLDEMAGQLRISAVSSYHSGLPFAGKINTCTLSVLAQSIIAYDSGTYTKGSLNVWTVGM
jgi:hypothetical protein